MTLSRSFSRIAPAIIVVTAIALGVSGCTTDLPTAASAVGAFSQSDLRVGTGAAAAAGNSLTVHYTGWYYDESTPEQKGLQFESSRGITTFTFTLGAGDVIAGWDTGLVGMRVGGIRRLVIPPSLAYGGTRAGVIPPNATLVFEVELLSLASTSGS